MCSPTIQSFLYIFICFLFILLSCQFHVKIVWILWIFKNNARSDFHCRKHNVHFIRTIISTPSLSISLSLAQFVAVSFCFIMINFQLALYDSQFRRKWRQWELKCSRWSHQICSIYFISCLWRCLKNEKWVAVDHWILW